MSVLDASLLTDALTMRGARGDAALDRFEAVEVWHAPHVLPAEVLSALRGLLLRGVISDVVAAEAQDRVRTLRLELHALDPFHERIWELRHNATPYDAWYLAIAEALDAPLVTTDTKMASVPGARCNVLVVAP